MPDAVVARPSTSEFVGYAVQFPGSDLMDPDKYLRLSPPPPEFSGEGAAATLRVTLTAEPDDDWRPAYVDSLEEATVWPLDRLDRALYFAAKHRRKIDRCHEAVVVTVYRETYLLAGAIPVA
jgi:hypothetical protein